MASAHQILDISFGADLETIKAAYKRLAKKYHPDVNSDPQASVRFQEVKEAYNELIADFPGYKPVAPSGSTKKNQPVTLRRRVAVAVCDLLSGTAVDMEGISGICPGCGGTGQRIIDHLVDCLACSGQGYHYREKGIIRLKIECVPCGGKGRCNFMPCEQCRGYGAIPASHGRLAIPPGTLPGSMIIVPGGASDPSQGIRGDLEVLVDQADADAFTVDGLDVGYRLLLPIWDFVLGKKVAVPLPRGGSVNLNVTPGTAVGKVFKLPSGGFPSEEGEVGAYLVTADLAIMDAADPAVRKAFEALKAQLVR